MNHPVADRQDIHDERHGRRIPDPYRWLEDPGAPATAAWTVAQDGLADDYFAPLASARREWRDRLPALDRADPEVPHEAGGRVFATVHPAGAEQAVCTATEDGRTRVVVDAAGLSSLGTVALHHRTPSPDGRLLAYQCSDGGDDRAWLRVRDVDTGADLGAAVEMGWPTPVAWLPDGGGFLYTREHAGPGRPAS